MNLAIITVRYPQKNEPYNHMFVHVRAKYFKQMNVNVEIFVPSNSNSNYEYEGIKVHQISSKEIIKRTELFDLTYLHLLNSYFFIKNGGNKIYQYLLKEKKPFAMYIHGTEILRYPNYLFDFSLSPKGILKYIYVNFWNSARMKQFFSITNKRNNSLFLFPSYWMKKHTEKVLKVSLNSFQIIPNGIDIKHFTYSNKFENRHKLLMIRPLSDMKYGFDMGIEIMKHLPEEYTLTIYGKGKYEISCQRLINKYNLSKRVFIKNNFIERENLPELFSHYGLFIATTRFDSQGVIMCEAMSSGLLTISNPVTAIPEFIKDGVTGITDVSMEKIAKKIITITNDKELYKKITSLARLSMEKISIEKTGNTELNALKSIIE